MREEEVGETAAGDGECVGDEDGHVGGVDEESHEEEVAEEREEAVGEMEAEECAGCCGARDFCLWPGVVEVPGEVVEERELDGESGGEEVVVRDGVVEDGEGGELRDDAEKADEVEAEESGEWAHGFVLRVVPAHPSAMKLRTDGAPGIRATPPMRDKTAHEWGTRHTVLWSC